MEKIPEWQRKIIAKEKEMSLRQLINAIIEFVVPDGDYNIILDDKGLWRITYYKTKLNERLDSLGIK